MVLYLEVFGGGGEGLLKLKKIKNYSNPHQKLSQEFHHEFPMQFDCPLKLQV
jgi:hypothetical protein